MQSGTKWSDRRELTAEALRRELTAEALRRELPSAGARRKYPWGARTGGTTGGLLRSAGTGVEYFYYFVTHPEEKIYPYGKAVTVVHPPLVTRRLRQPVYR